MCLFLVIFQFFVIILYLFIPFFCLFWIVFHLFVVILHILTELCDFQTGNNTHFLQRFWPTWTLRPRKVHLVIQYSKSHVDNSPRCWILSLLPNNQRPPSYVRGHIIHIQTWSFFAETEHNIMISKYLIPTISLYRIKWNSDWPVPSLSDFTVSSLPLSSHDSTTFTELCKSIWPFRQGKVPLAPARGTHGSQEEKCPTPPPLCPASWHYSWNIHIFIWPGWSRQPPIGGGWIGPEQEMRFYWCGGSECDGRMARRPVRLLDRSISPHRWGQGQVLQGFRWLFFLCKWQHMEVESKSWADLMREDVRSF